MNSSNTKAPDLTVKYSLIQLMYWSCFAAILGFVSIYLLDAGFTNTEIGMIIAVGGIISAVLQPLVASYADLPSSPSIRVIMIILGIIVAVMSGIMIFLKQPLAIVSLLYGICITIQQLITPLINSLGIESLNQGQKMNYGLARGMGSVGYAVLSFLLGRFVKKTGAGIIPIVICVGYILFTVLLLTFPFRKVSKEKQPDKKEKAQESHGLLYFIRKYKRFSIVLVGCILLYISHVLLNSFTFQIVESKGGTSAEMGVGIAIASLIELPVLFLFTKMLKKASAGFWFRISGIFFMLKTLGSLLAPNMTVFYAVQFLQIGGWALITVASVYYINTIMEPEDSIKGQAYFTMTYTLGSVIGALLGGALIDQFGVSMMLIVGTVCAFVGMLIQLIFTSN